MDKVDMDHSGSIDYSEFIIATMDLKKAMSKEKLKEAFEIFDKDGNGFITESEIKDVLGGCFEKSDNNIWEKIIGEID